MFRRAVKRFSAAATVATEAAAASAVKPVIERPKKPTNSVFSRFRAFVGGAVMASAVGMYVIAFQLQGLLDEVKSAVHDVSVRQTMIESKLAKLSHDSNPDRTTKSSE
jgi:hypothetical protein